MADQFAGSRCELASSVNCHPVLILRLLPVIPLWDARTGKLRALLGRHEGAVTAAAFSPGGDWLVTASQDGTARLWDAATGSERFVLRGHEGAVHGAAFSPDGKRVATVGEDGTARVWDVATGQPWMTLTGHGGPVYCATFSPDGERLATTSGDGTARIWPVDPLPLARARRPRDFTPEERLRFGIAPAAEADRPPRAMQGEPADLGAWSRAAFISLAAGDAAAYRRTCGDIVQTFGRSTDPNVINSAAWACAVGPDAVADFEPLVRALTAALGPNPDPNYLNTLGALLYRAGHFEEAVKRLDEAVAKQDKVGTAPDWLFLAMAHHRLGHAEQARKWLDRAVQSVEQSEGGSWEQRLELQLLRHEAERLLTK